MNVKLFLTKNAPTILTYIGSLGVVATTITAVRATPKAILILEEVEELKGEELTTSEKIIAAAPVYIPSLLIGISTISCIVGANILNKRNQAMLTSAYALLDSSFKEYKEKVIELYGEDTDEEIKTELAKDNYDKDKVIGSENKTLFYDEYSKRYFESTTLKVQQAEYYVNRDLTTRDYVYLNEFYEHLGIPTIDSGWKLGWSTGACLDMYWQNWIDFTHKKITLKDGTECLSIIMFQEPILNFEDYA